MRSFTLLVLAALMFVLALAPAVVSADEATTTPEALEVEITPTPEALEVEITPTPEPVTTPPQPTALRTFRQSPTLDLRAVSLNVTKESDAQFEIFIGNPVKNQDVNVVGEILFRVPPGITIFSSILGGSGSTGLVQVPFVDDPIKPGDTRVLTVFARGESVGTFNILSIVTYWPEGNADADKDSSLNFRLEIKEPRDPEAPSPVFEPPVAEATATPEPPPTPAPPPPPPPTPTSEVEDGEDGDGALPTWLIALVAFLGAITLIAIIIVLGRVLL